MKRSFFVHVGVVELFVVVDSFPSLRVHCATELETIKGSRRKVEYEFE